MRAAATIVDLVSSQAHLLALLPDCPDATLDFIRLDDANLVRPPGHLHAPCLTLESGRHFYGHHVVDVLSIHGDKPTLRALGLVLLATIFHRDVRRVAIEAGGAESTVRTLIVESDGQALDGLPGLVTRPHAFNYYPGDVERHPWLAEAPSPYDLPMVGLTNRSEAIYTAEDYANRDVAVGFGSISATARLAALMLDLGRPSNATDEVRLEGEAGFRGVGPASAEVTIWLPGSFGYVGVST